MQEIKKKETAATKKGYTNKSQGFDFSKGFLKYDFLRRMEKKPHKLCLDI